MRQLKLLVLCLLLFFIFFLYLITRKELIVKPVSITVLLSATCPDSIRFIRNQLFPLWSVSPDKLSIQLVMFGKARISFDKDKNFHIECQHGPEECEKNLYWSCLMRKWPIQQWFPFVNCLADGAWNPLTSARDKCANKLGVSQEKLFEISQCTESDEGRELHQLMGNITNRLAPTLPYVPHLIVNGMRKINKKRQHPTEASDSDSDSPAVKKSASGMVKRPRPSVDIKSATDHLESMLYRQADESEDEEASDDDDDVEDENVNGEEQTSSDSEGENKDDDDSEADTTDDDDEDLSSDEHSDDPELDIEEVTRYDFPSLTRTAPLRDDSTRRLAVMNFNWDRATVWDLYAILRSYLPPGGSILSLVRYPSEYGMQAMARGEVFFNAISKYRHQEEATDSTEKMETQNGDQQEPVDDNGEGSSNKAEERRVRDRIRQHQVERLKFFYAIVELDSVRTAEVLYESLDDLELERSGIRLDLRFVDDSLTFETPEEWRHLEETCDMSQVASKMAQYSEGYLQEKFVVPALCSTRVDLETWDETPLKRKKAIKALFQKMDEEGDDDEFDLDDSELREFLAMSEDEEDEVSEDDESNAADNKEENESVNEKEEVQDKKMTREERLAERRRRAREMLIGGGPEDGEQESGGNETTKGKRNVFSKKKLSKAEKAKEKLHQQRNVKAKIEASMEGDGRFDDCWKDPNFTFEQSRLDGDELAKSFHEFVVRKKKQLKNQVV